jgi:membrane-associated phospholipid phosphatase
MLIATPIHGSHYFVDLIAGAAVAVACIWLSGRMLHFAQSVRWATIENCLTLPLRLARITQPR